MRCDEALNQLSARADGELPADEAAALEAHLAECSQCRAASEALPMLDKDLRRALAPRRAAAARLADNTLAMLASDSAAVSVVPQAAPAPRFAWGQTLLAMAAGFLLAVMVFRPWQPGAAVPQVLRSLDPVARLTAASGPVEVRLAGQFDFLTCSPAARIEPESVIRTGPTGRCELAMQDGNALRLDCNTEVKLRKVDLVEVSHGRLFSCSRPDGNGPEIQSAGGTIFPKAASQVAIDRQPQGARLIVIEGIVDVKQGQQSIQIGPGNQLRIADGKLEQPEACDSLLETSWVNSLLALDGSDHPELDRRVNRLLAQVGAAKLSLLYEDELRRLGDAAVPPLLAYLAATRETPNVAQRVVAARIVADAAQSRSILDLIALLTDTNANVRFHAARGLERLTGRDQGLQPDTWKSAPQMTCESTHDKWLAWWAANRERYPHTEGEAPATKADPF